MRAAWLCVMFLCGSPPLADQRSWAPGPAAGDWPVKTPESLGLEAASMQSMADAIAAGLDGIHENVHAVLVVKEGALVYEQYFTGMDSRRVDGKRQRVETTFERNTLHDSRSIAKSVVSILVGIAFADGDIASVDAPLFGFFPEQEASPEHRRITLRDALMMAGGLRYNLREVPFTEPENDYNRLARSEDPVATVLSWPVVEPPGERYLYNDGLTVMLGMVVGRATGAPLGAYARDRLFQAIGIERFEWRSRSRWHRVPELAGIEEATVVSPATGLWLSPRDFARIGQLYLQQGRWEGRQIVPEAWVEESTATAIAKGPYPTSLGVGTSVRGGYGYQWHTLDLELPAGRFRAFNAHGNGGQVIVAVPALELLFLHFAGNYNQPGANRGWRELLLRYVLPWAAGAPVPGPPLTDSRPFTTDLAGLAVVDLDATALAAYTGEYVEGDQRIRVTALRGALRMTPTDAGPPREPVDLLPLGDHRFAPGSVVGGRAVRLYWPEAENRLEFLVEDGRATGYVSRDAGRVVGEAARIGGGE